MFNMYIFFCITKTKNLRVDAVIAYDCSKDMSTHLLVIHSALHVQSTKYILILPFIMSEVRLVINNIPCFHYVDRITVEGHYIVDQKRLHIPLNLKRVVSVFETRRISNFKVEDSVIFNKLEMTLQAIEWYLQDSVYVDNEHKYIDDNWYLFILLPLNW